VREHDFDLDVAAIEAAITERTRVVIVNTPHNPTGRIYPQATLQALADMLDRASERIGRRIFLLSDEPYNRIVFDDARFMTPALVYPWTLVAYSYGKVLLAPGQRLGYLAVSPLMPDRDRQMVRAHLPTVQVASGWAFPNAIMQHAIERLEELSIDMAALQRKRDRMVAALRAAGYAVQSPEGTFYLMPRAPLDDDVAFADRLADHDVFVLPGKFLKMPGYFRICLTATEDMVERSLPVFRELGARG
jgi:aspartate aminotransferase